MKQRKEKAALIILVLLIFVALLMTGLLIGLKQWKSTSAAGSGQAADSEYYPDTEETVEKWQEGVVSYNGKHYVYNPNINVYLFLGIDKDGPVEPAKDYISGGQSDAIFLLVTNSDTKELSIVSIHRNTMTQIEVFNRAGTSLGMRQLQLCLQHGYGDGRKYSCILASKAVSRLMYNLPMNGYMAINMGGIPLMNDAIGGVTVEVLEDLSYPSEGVDLVKGEVVTLSGREAYYYLRGRDLETFDSASMRLRRQEQYIAGFFSKLHESVGTNSTAMIDIYSSIKSYLETDMDVSEILKEIAGYEYKPENLYTVPGKAQMGEQFEEFIVDQDALYEMILEVFYKEVQ